MVTIGYVGSECGETRGEVSDRKRVRPIIGPWAIFARETMGNQLASKQTA